MSNVGIPVTVANAAEVAVAVKDAKSIMVELAKPFHESEIKVKPAKVSGNRALALWYIDARHVMDRLDETLGIDGWRDEYTVLEGGQEVECRLSLKIGGVWITKADVGGESEQPDGGDRMKAAYSDALKRAAVKFGVGRFLYRMPQTWMDYDPTKKQIIRTPAARPQQQPAPPVQRTLADKCVATILATTDPVKLSNIYRTYEADLKAGKFSDEEKTRIDAAFKSAPARVPA